MANLLSNFKHLSIHLNHVSRSSRSRLSFIPNNVTLLKPIIDTEINNYRYFATLLSLPYTYNNNSLVFVQTRQLYSDEVLGIDRFVQLRQQVQQRFGSHRDLFVQRLNEHIENEQNAILSEDLKNIIFLCETSEHIELLRKAIDKFEKQNESLRLGLFQFGPVVMRLAKHLNNVDMAMWIFEPKYRKFFSQLSSVTIAMDILFDNGRYDDVLKLFDYATSKFDFDVKYPVDFVVLYFGACYKLNTLASFESAFRILRSANKENIQVKLRGLYFFLMLAVNQNHSNIALEIIHQLNLKSMNIIMQSIRLLANAKLNRFHDVNEILRFQLKKDKAINKSKVIYNDTLEEIKKLVQQNCKKTEMIQTFENFAKNLEEFNLIEKDRKLEDALVQNIDFIRRKFRNMNDEPQQYVQKQ